MRDRYIGKGLSDHRHAMACELLDDGRLEYTPGGGIECLGVVERGLLREKYVLRQEFSLEAIEIATERLLAIREFPVPGHRLDAEQVGHLHHVGALHGVGEAGALPEIAAVEQQGASRTDIAAQAIDQRFQMCEAAQLAEACRGFLEIEAGKGIGVGAISPDSEPVDEGTADQ